jgi:hypothetical protein
MLSPWAVTALRLGPVINGNMTPAVTRGRVSAAKRGGGTHLGGERPLDHPIA